jgi:NAD(P)-dependent dehydrogenase (short-subunit alcohol dehydrogenase family)
VLANNAGGSWPNRQLTSDGHELTYQANHLAMFLLTELLRERLVASSPARVIVTSSSAHNAGRLADLDDLDREKSYKVGRVYGTSKLLNILYTRQLAKSFDGTGVTAYSFHPGSVATKFGRDQKLVAFAYQGPLRVFFKTPEQGADTLVYLATAPVEELQDGGFYFKRKPWRMSAAARDEDAPARIWKMSEDLVGPTSR